MTPKNIRQRIAHAISKALDEGGSLDDVYDGLVSLFEEMLSEARVGDES